MTTESKHLKTSEEQKFEVALKSKTISESSLDEMKEVLRYVMLKIGLRTQSVPNDFEKLILFEHIVSNFGGNRIDEIKLAFDLAIGGKLDVEVNCYENFSCYYFSMIMNAYRAWSSQTYRQVVKPEVPEQKIFTQEELDNSAREDAARQYVLFVKGNKPKSPEINKAILVKDGLMKEDESVENFFKSCLEKGYRRIYMKG